MKFAYHSSDENFPGSIDIQKKQWPDARWIAEPTSNNFGGHIMGFLPNGNEVHEFDGVLVTHQKMPPYDEKLHYVDRSRIARKRAIQGLTRRGKPTPVDKLLAGFRIAYDQLNNRQFVDACARGEIDMGKFHRPLQSLAQKMVARRNPGLTEQSQRASGDRE